MRDLQGNPLSGPVTVSFTTLRILLNEDIDTTRIILVEPDLSGLAQILGAPGAVPADALLFAENTTSLATTTSLTAEQDGSFETAIEASLSDVILLHVVGEGGEEIIVELTPFRTSDLRGAFVGPLGGRFSTVDGIVVTVPEGAFDRPTLVRLEPQSGDEAEAEAPVGFDPSFAFKLDLGGAQANKGLRLSVPAPPGAQDGVYLLSREIEILGELRWQMDDLAVLLDGRITTEDDSAAGASIAGILAQGLRAATVDGLAGVSGGGLVERYLTGVTASGAPARLEALAAPATNRPREFLPGMFAPGRDAFYQFWRAGDALAFPVLSFGPQPNLAIFNGDLLYAASVDAAIARLVPEKVAIPTRLGQPFDLEVKDLTTGFEIFQGEFDPPQDDGAIIELPADALDKDPPLPVSGSPIRFFPLALGEEASQELARGIFLDFDGQTLTLSGDPSAVQPEVRLRLVGLDTNLNQFTTSLMDGSFELSATAEPGARFVLAVGARIETSHFLEIGFNEAMGAGFPGIEVRDGTSASAPLVEIDRDQVGTRERVRLVPDVGWRAGETYTLRLTPELADDAGNTWDRTLEIRFEILESQPLDVYLANEARDVARLGSLLFVAAGPQGLALLDASNPTELKNVIPGDLFFPFPFNERSSVRGVAVDRHGRVLVTGGGDSTFGLLRIFDPLMVDPEGIAGDPDRRLEPFRGSTIVSNFPGGDLDLPTGTPRRLAILGNDEVTTWRVGEEPPAGINVSPAMPPEGVSQFRLTVTGNDGTEHQPVMAGSPPKPYWGFVGIPESSRFVVSSRPGYSQQMGPSTTGPL